MWVKVNFFLSLSFVVYMDYCVAEQTKAMDSSLFNFYVVQKIEEEEEMEADMLYNNHLSPCPSHVFIVCLLKK